MGLDCSMLWRGGKSSQAVGAAGLFGACHRDASRERRRAAALSRFAALQRVRVSPKNRGSVNAALCRTGGRQCLGRAGVAAL